MRILIFCILMASGCFADIKSISSIKEMGASITDNALIVFDIDDTLTILEDPAFHRPNFKIHHAEAFNELMSNLNAKEQGLTFTIPLLTTSSDLIETDTAEFISQLQNKGTKAIALTAAMGGDIDGTAVEDRRICELNRVGIDFSRSFPEIFEMDFVGFKIPLLGRVPFFKSGVIFTNENNKGDVLVAFLKSISLKPTRILFVDDRLEHLHAVRSAVETYDPEIEFEGFHFKSDKVPYVKVDIETFNQKWTEHAEMAKQILSKVMID